MFIFIIFSNNLCAQAHIRNISKVIANKPTPTEGYRFFDFLNEGNINNQKYFQELSNQKRKISARKYNISPILSLS